MSKYGIVINTKRCFGCQTCVVGCKVDNQVPGELYWSRIESLDGDVLYQATGTFPNCKLAFRALLCNHCDAPACLASCATGAIKKDAETGIVSIDPEACIGCGTCVEACPYGMPVLDKDENAASKCDLCADRVSAGLQPWCVVSCPGIARTFGDLDDPNSEASKLIAANNAKPWHEEYSTSPNVYYF